MPVLYESQFCCGLLEMGDFPEDALQEDVTVKQLTRQINQEIVRECEGETDTHDESLTHSLGIIATTISPQIAAIAALKRADFVPLVRFTNPKTKNEVTLWFRAPKPL